MGNLFIDTKRYPLRRLVWNPGSDPGVTCSSQFRPQHRIVKVATVRHTDHERPAIEEAPGGSFVNMVAGGGPIMTIGSSYGRYTALGCNYPWGDRLVGPMLSEPIITSRADRQVPEQTILVEDDDLVAGLEPDGSSGSRSP